MWEDPQASRGAKVSRNPGFTPSSQAMWAWDRLLTTLCLHLLICKMGVMVAVEVVRTELGARSLSFCKFSLRVICYVLQEHHQFCRYGWTSSLLKWSKQLKGLRGPLGGGGGSGGMGGVARFWMPTGWGPARCSALARPDEGSQVTPW